MVTSTSTPASMLMMICLTTSVGAWRSMRPKSAVSCCPTDCLEWYALTLVDAHLVGVPGLGTLTARSLTGGDLQVLGGQTDGALDAELLVLGTVDELLADLLEGRDLAGGEGDADLVDLGLLALLDLLGIVGRHLGGVGGEECDRDLDGRVSMGGRDRNRGCDCTYLGLCVGLGNVTIVQNRNQCAVRGRWSEFVGVRNLASRVGPLCGRRASVGNCDLCPCPDPARDVMMGDC